MPDVVSVSDPAMLDIRAPHGGVDHGGSQLWYSSFWRRQAGCGPTAASNIVWYLACSRDECRGLWDVRKGNRDSFLALMDTMFDFVTPGLKGVNSTKLFREGLSAFFAGRCPEREVLSLDIPERRAERPDPCEASAFLRDALALDCPVAFLNLSNGRLFNLDKWHWVTLVSLDTGRMSATMLDQGRSVEIDLGLWLETTTLGGGFCCVR